MWYIWHDQCRVCSGLPQNWAGVEMAGCILMVKENKKGTSWQPSLVPSIHWRRKERLVLAICTCVTLTIFIAPLYCIMTQPCFQFIYHDAASEEKVKQSPHGHFSMASSHHILRLRRLYTVIASCHYVEEYQNNTVSQISGKICDDNHCLVTLYLSLCHCTLYLCHSH